MKKIYAIILVAFALITGFMVGGIVVMKMWQRQNVKIESLIRASNRTNKISTLITALERSYVEEIDVDSLVEEVLPVVLEELDPHSAYYPAEEAQESNDELHGSFSGIGIQFSVQEDTIRVNSVIRGGPSEKVGLMAGDRIILIDDSLYAGQGISSNDVIKNLKGPEGTEVTISVMRTGEPDLIDFTIERGPIPIKSVDAAYMLTKEVGYILINKFGETTYSEMMNSLAYLSNEGMKKLVVDLRGNTGGYLGSAIQMVNEFLPKNDMIVYTEGAHSRYAEQRANGYGRYQTIPLVVLIDETSASASEIFAGAVQDNDRGTIVGRRSYGKGLVQEPIDFSDGSSIRLTIARYYTPSGRCIQKPYGEDSEDYAMDIVKRYEHGEFFSADSVKHNEDEVYKTKNGRTVYGGGGIMPDHFVPQDTIAYSEYYASIVRKSIVNKFSFRYVDGRRTELAKYNTTENLTDYLNSNNVLSQLQQAAANEGVKRDASATAEAIAQLKRLLYATIIYDAMEMEDYVKYINEDDSTVKKAIEVLE
jgi:carboxyl-terminal processing protease